MHRISLLLLATGALLVMGCDFNDPNWAHYANCNRIGGASMTRVVDDPENCGRCGLHCVGGVPCANYTCQMNSVLHCGAANRECVAVDSDDVACVRFLDGDASVGDAGAPPPGVELVGGYGCVPIGGSGDGADAGAPEQGAEGQSKRLDPTWLLIPGHTPQCLDGFETNGCVTGEVALTDLCGTPVTEPLAYDFTIMTEEMSREQYRDLMCDCAAPRFASCRALCAERDAPDATIRAQQPMTGLNWCEAYAACQAMDARLPTARERARLDGLVGESAVLFDERMSCGAWAAATGEVPWLVECLEELPDDVQLDAVKGDSGRVYVGEGILSEPEPVRHLLGNVDEWAADPVSTLVATQSTGAATFWGVPRDDAEARQPRVLRGRSLFSPAGETGDRLLAVDPSLRSEDVGVRCARTTGSPYAEPVPYDATVNARDHVRCEEEPVALRPLRRTVGEQAYRAVDVCVDRDLPSEGAARLEEPIREMLISRDEEWAFARRVSAGVLEAVGIARFAGDEQWWRTEPVDQPEQRLGLQLEETIPFWLTWQGEHHPQSSRCIGRSSTSTSDGKLLRRHDFTLSEEHIWALGLDGRVTACAHLDCVEETISDEACPTDCPGWVLPLAIEFERVEPYSAGLCR